jgi:exonuclease III
MVLRAQIDINTVLVGNLNTSLSPIDSSRQKIIKEISVLLHTSDQIDMVDIYRVFYPTTKQYTFFSPDHGTSSKIDNILGHKASLKNSRKPKKKNPCIISDHNGIKLDFDNKESPDNLQTFGDLKTHC